MKKSQEQRLPPGWDEARVRRLAEYYDNQTEDEAMAEHEAALGTPHQTLIEVPVEILPEVRELLARYEREHPTTK